MNDTRIDRLTAIRNGLNLAADTVDPASNGGEHHEVVVPGILLAELLRATADQDLAATGVTDAVLSASSIANLILDGVRR